MAVKLYKAAKCDSVGMDDTYYKWAARALGHAIHLVEDMGSPQHARPENHAPFPIGTGPSYVEYWSVDVWDREQTYKKPDGSKEGVGKLVRAAETAARARTGSLEGVMGSMAAEARQWPMSSPYASGAALTFPELERVLSRSGVLANWNVVQDAEGNPIRFKLSDFTVAQYPDYYSSVAQDSGKSKLRHRFGRAFFEIPDFTSDSVLDQDEATVGIQSFELATRLWAEPDALHPENPIIFDLALKELITSTTEAAAGAILAFWEAVRDYDCPCSDFTPCAFKWGADRDPDCDGLPGRGRGAGGEYMDDNASVVATTAESGGGAASASTAVDEVDSVGLLNSWRRIAAVGVEKGVPSLVDFGRMMWLLEVGSDERLTEESALDVAQAVGAIERKYSEPLRRPEEDLDRAAHVALFNEGFSGGAEQVLGRLGLPFARLDVTFDPLFAAAEYPVLFVPSGGLYGTAGSQDLRERFQAYVEAGGTMLVMAQMRGVDLTAVPTPAGEVLTGFGWFEDQSCFRDNVRVAALHPILAHATREVLSVPVDGFLDRWPAASTVLLRRIATGTAAMLTYPLGAGHVVVTTVYDDWAEANRTTSPDGLAIIANALAWGRADGAERPECRYGRPCATLPTVTLRNLSEDAADVVEWSLRTATGETAMTWSETLELAGGTDTVAIPVPPGTIVKGPGIYRIFYTLHDSARTVQRTGGGSEPWVVQPAAEGGQVLIQAWPEELTEAPLLGVGLAVDSELVENHSSIPVHVSIQSLSDTPASGQVVIDYWAPACHGAELLATEPFSVAEGSAQRLDAVVGPLTLQSGHDGLAGGGTLRARVYVGASTEPAAVALINVLTNARLLDVELVPSPTEASNGDTVSVLGTMSNQSLGSLTGRYRFVYTNRFSVFSAVDQIRKSDWKPFTVAPGAAIPLVEPFTVPDDWQGAVYVRMFVCYPDLPCWTSGFENAGIWDVAATAFAVPMPRVRLTHGEPTVTGGPAIRVPINVTNVGSRRVESGQVRLSGGGNEVRSGAFNLGVGGATDLVLDLPFEPAGPFEERTLGMSFTDRTWRAADSLNPWRFARPVRVSYGVETKVSTPLVALPGSGVAAGEIVIHNTSSFPRRFRVELACQELGYSEVRWVEARAFEDVAVPMEILVPEATPYGWGELVVRASDSDYLDTTERFAVWLADPAIRFLWDVAATPRAGYDLPLTIGIVPKRLGGELPGTLELEVIDAGWSSTHAVVLVPGAANEIKVEVPLPADLAAGSHTLRARWLEANGHSVEKDFVFRVPPPRYEARCTANHGEAGGSLTYEVSNVGGAAGRFAMEWRLRQGFTELTAETLEANLAAGETTAVEVQLPGDLVSGSYLAEGTFLQGTGEPNEVLDAIAVVGLVAELEVATDKPVFRLGETIPGQTTVRSGGVALQDGRLHLEVQGVSVSCARPDSWGVFQGNPARDGYSRVGRLPFEWPGVRLVAVAGIPASGAVVAAAAGDIDGDGNDDVVVVENGATTSDLACYVGPNLTLRTRTPLGAVGAAAAVAVGSFDGEPRVFAVEVLAAGGMRVRAFDGGLGLVWEAPQLAAATSARPFPGGAPIFADLTGDGRDELVVSTGSDVVGLGVTDGAVVWRMGAASPAPAGWTITGMSAGDAAGDGTVRLAVAYATGEDPPGGALDLVAPSGALSWRITTVNPTVGSPVLLPADDGSLSVAVVETPADPALSSSLVIVGHDGAVRAASTFAFWSSFQPAAADLDADGRPELVVVSGTAECRTCGLNGVVVFRDDGSVFCFDSTWPPPAATPILIDIDGHDGPDLTTITSGGGYLPAVEAWETTYCGPVAYGETEEVSPLFVLDIDGDCVPEIFAGNLAFATVPMPPGVSAAEPAQAAPGGDATVEVLWSWDGPIDLAAAATEQVWHELDTQGRTGFFTLAGRLENDLGQAVAQSSSTFAVVDSPIELSFAGLAPAYAPGALVELVGTVSNAGTLPANVEISAVVDGVPMDAAQRPLDPGDEVPYTLWFEAGEPGTCLVEVIAAADGVEVASGQILLVVQEPAATLEVEAPPVVGSEAFQVCVHVTNPTDLTLDLEVAAGFEPDLSPPKALTLAPRAHSARCSEEILESDAVFAATVTGDANATASRAVNFDAVPEFEVLGSTTLEAGDTVLEVEVRNPGTRSFVGPLNWELTGSGTGSGAVQLRLEPGAATSAGLSVRLDAGAAHLALQAGPSSSVVELLAYSGGIGHLSLTVPAEASEGPVSVEVAVSNELTVAGSFAAVVEVRDGASGSPEGGGTFAWQLAAGASAWETAVFALGPGTFRIEAWLEGDPADRVVRTVTVRPRRQIGVTAALGALAADGTLPLTAVLTNTGAEAAEATLAITLGGDQVLTAVTVPLEGSTQRVLPLQVDALPSGPSTIEVVVLDGGGEPEAATAVELDVTAAQLAIRGALADLEATAGSAATLQVPVVNSGMQSGSYQLAVEVAGGAVFSGAHDGALGGGATAVVPILMPLSPELPAGTVPGRVTLLAEQPGGVFETVVEQAFDVTVSPYPLAVEPRLDRDSAGSGETVGLEVEVSCPPGTLPRALVAVVTYGDHEERRDLMTGSTPLSLRFDVPIDAPGRDVLVGVYWPSGRAAYLGQLTVHPASGEVLVRSTQPEWLPGDVAVLDVTLERPGHLELFAFHQSLALEGSGQETLTIPEDTAFGEYPVIWTFHGEPPNGGILNGSAPLRVRGPRVRITAFDVPAARVTPGDTVAASLAVLSDATLDTTLKCWLETPSGEVQRVASESLHLESGRAVRFELPVDVATTEPGTHTVIVALFHSLGASLVDARARLDVGSGALVGLRVDRTEAHGHYLASVGTQGTGTGLLSLFVDGREVEQRSLTLDGISTFDVAFMEGEPGEHVLDAVLDVGGPRSSRSAGFTVPSADQAPDCSLAQAVPAVLTTRNFQLVPIEIAGVTDPEGQPVTLEITSVQQDEPVWPWLDGWCGIFGVACIDATLDPLAVRAWTDLKGDGRVYHIGFTATDSTGNTSDGEVTVCVPLRPRREPSCVDGGALFDSTGGNS